MAKQVKQARNRAQKSNLGARKGARNEQKFGAQVQDRQPKSFVSKNICVAVVVCIGFTCVLLYILRIKTLHEDNIKQKGHTADIPKTAQFNKLQNEPEATKIKTTADKEEEETSDGATSQLYEGFKPNLLKRLNVKSVDTNGWTVKVKALQHSYKGSSVRAYLLENFLSPYECDSLAAAHKRHVSETSKLNPLLCFDSVKTFKQNLKEIGLKTIEVSDKDFMDGTTCINESLSSLLKSNGMKWSYSTSFYPGESQFSVTLQERIKLATGLTPENGGKFQITSYPQKVGYKNHTDCVEGGREKRDRFATILVYLKDVPQGGETIFPELGWSILPRKGLGLVWNSMTADGVCDPSSIHNAAKVIQGRKYILQRWYYYQNFPSLGKRFPEPGLPPRKQNQPRVSCDQYEFGSCRWYDEWNFDHIKEYVLNQHKFV